MLIQPLEQAKFKCSPKNLVGLISINNFIDGGDLLPHLDICKICFHWCHVRPRHYFVAGWGLRNFSYSWSLSVYP